MSAAESLVELDRRTDDEAPPRVARVPPDALIQIVRETVSVGGAIWIRVTGKSMNPIIRHGDRVLITALRGRLRRGAVVLVDAHGTPILHRVTSHRAGLVITKGDSRRMCDQPHPVTSVLGRALVVRREGVSVCLAPTLALGVAPLARAAAWWFRTRLPNDWMVRVLRGWTHAR